MDTLANWIGYAIIYSGGVLLTLTLIGIVAWACLEWWWRRYTGVKFLREFIQWKRNSYPG